MNVMIKDDNEVPYNKERFLPNKHNKIEQISLLSEYFKTNGQNVHVCKDDADTKICDSGKPVTVVADDTDMMLLYHLNEKLFDIFLLQERGKKCWSMKDVSLK